MNVEGFDLLCFEWENQSMDQIMNYLDYYLSMDRLVKCLTFKGDLDEQVWFPALLCMQYSELQRVSDVFPYRAVLSEPELIL